MFTHEEVTFEPEFNSLLLSALVDKNSHNKIVNNSTEYYPEDRLTNNLGLISGLYIYTNTPPHGYGSQGPKVAETVKRSYEFNRKKEENKILKIDNFNIERSHWEASDGVYPLDKVTGNYHAYHLHNMARDFLVRNVAQIDACVKDTIDYLETTNSDILTKGRQTLCAFTDQSVTSSVAYERALDFLNMNFSEKKYTCLEWIQHMCKLFNLKSIRCPEIVEVEEFVKDYIPDLKMRVTTKKKNKKLRTKVYNGPTDIRKKLFNLYRSFASYIKHKERNKKDRRAIASATCFLRMLLFAVEDFHLRLGKDISGSTISIGGEEKKQKITSTLMGLSLPGFVQCYLMQGTEDATKWNECLSPSAFAMMHKTFFDEKLRKFLDLPPVSEEGMIFLRICNFCHFIQSIKRVQMGPGPMAIVKGKLYNRLDWKNTEIERFNKKTQEWLVQVRDKIDEDNYITASPGMLMGMLNAGSTTFGLLGLNYRMDINSMQVVTLRSSDDSTTVYIGRTPADIVNCVEYNNVNLKLKSINLSSGKTLFFKYLYSEYTSWFQDGQFISQFGVETSSIRPQGKNPPDDFHAISRGTATGLKTLLMNPMGAYARLITGINGIKRLWAQDNRRIIIELYFMQL